MTSINTATIEQLERLIDSAKYSVDSHEREIIRHQTDLEIDPEDSWSKKQIVEANKDLVKAKHRLRVFTSRLEELKSVNAPTRFEVIDKEAGRLIVRHDVKVDLSFQDNGQTLKVFLS